MNITTTDKQGRSMVDLASFDYTDKRRIFIFEAITDETARRVITELDYLDSISSEDITVCINSPGGSVSAGLAILDAMKRCRCDIRTFGTGMCASMGAVLLACGGTNGKREITANCEVMIHQPIGGVQGSAGEVELAAKRIVRTRQRLNRLLAEATGKTEDRVGIDSDRDNFMSADEALKYGLADKIV